MTFGHPWMLLGALAALIPLLVHLFDRRRPRPHPFAAISFVLRSQKRTASRLKLKRLLLYALRTLILLAIPVALARPEWKKRGTAAQTARGPAATAIVVDASLSMRYRDGQTNFAKGQELARDALKDLLPEEPATVVLCTQSPPPPASPGFDRGRLRSIIDEAKPTFAPADMSRCLELAAHALEESPLPGKRLVAISDFTTNAFRLDAPLPTVPNARGEQVRPELVLRDVAGKPLPNHAIVDLKAEPASQAGPRAFQFTVTIRNFSAQPAKDVQVALKTGARVVAKGFVDLAANGTAQKTLSATFESGGPVSGEVQVAPDSLDEDDRRAFVVNVPRELRALVVNGEPNPVRYRDEAFFVDAALTASGSPVRETLRDPDSGLKEDLSQYDVVLLLNTGAPSPDEAAKLKAYVENGGGLFISMGDRVDPEQYNQRLGELLPRPLRLVKTAALPTDPDVDTKAAHLATIQTDHPVLAPFVGKAKEGLASARFYRYMLLEAGAGKGGPSEVLAAYEDGAPAMAVARRGKGRVMLFTSTVDHDWSDFPIRTSFLPWMQRSCAYLTGSLEERESLQARVGESITLKPDGHKELKQVRSPSNEDVAVRRQPDGTVSVGPLAEPGLYTVIDGNGQPDPSLAFSVSLDPAESDLTRYKTEELAAAFGEETVRPVAGEGASRSVPFWTWLIVAAALAFFAEGTLLRE